MHAETAQPRSQEALKILDSLCTWHQQVSSTCKIQYREAKRCETDTICVCRLILQHLAQAGSYEQQHACSQQLEEIKSSLRFVKYELGRKGQQGAEAELATPVDDLKVHLPAGARANIAFTLML